MKIDNNVFEKKIQKILTFIPTLSLKLYLRAMKKKLYSEISHFMIRTLLTNVGILCAQLTADIVFSPPAIGRRDQSNFTQQITLRNHTITMGVLCYHANKRHTAFEK